MPEITEQPENNPEPKNDADSLPLAETAPADLIGGEGAQKELPGVEAPAQIITPAQIISGEPDSPGQPAEGEKLRKRGRPSLPWPECKKCERKHPEGPCPAKGVKLTPPNRMVMGQSRVVIPGESAPLADAEELIGGETEGAQPATTPAVNHRQLAEITFDLCTNSMAVFVGEEWRAQNKEEREGMLVPLEMYLRSKQMDDIPPGAILCFAIATYSAPRLRVPNTAGKLKRGWQWLKNKLTPRGSVKPSFPVNHGN